MGETNGNEREKVVEREMWRTSTKFDQVQSARAATALPLIERAHKIGCHLCTLQISEWSGQYLPHICLIPDLGCIINKPTLFSRLVYSFAFVGISSLSLLPCAVRLLNSFLHAECLEALCDISQCWQRVSWPAKQISTLLGALK